MAIIIDRSQAPALLRYTLTGSFPTLQEQTTVREEEIAAGALTAETRGLIDVRQVTSLPHVDQIMARSSQPGTWPLRRVYLVKPGEQFGVARQMQILAPAKMQIAIYTDEQEALAWLLGTASDGDT